MRISGSRGGWLRSGHIRTNRAEKLMRYFPIFLNLEGQAVLLVGGGAVAERKIRMLLKAGAAVEVAAPQLSPNIERWKQDGELIHIEGNWHPGLLEGKRLVFAASSNSRINREVFTAAEKLGIPANAVDDPKFCRFISPAIIDRSPVQVAVSTGGMAPVLARRIRAWIETLLPLGLGKVALAAGRIRPLVNRTLPAAARREFWESLITESRIYNWSSDSEIRIGAFMNSALRRPPALKSEGKVFLVGAGPGRADLLTLRALEVLGQADVILHDRLVPEEILEMARRDAERIYVGKRAGSHHCSQHEIHDLLLKEAGRGRMVVRLKGGDPFIFGRGGEELEFLRAHGVNYEVVPGITAATGCAAYAGIPLTHRDHAQTLTFVTGHRSAEPGSKAIDWSAIAGPGRTAVVYMGVGQADAIREQLVSGGISRRTPAVLITDGTRDSQQHIEGTVGSLPSMATKSAKNVPGLLIIGQVAALGGNLAWFRLHSPLRKVA